MSWDTSSLGFGKDWIKIAKRRGKKMKKKVNIPPNTKYFNLKKAGILNGFLGLPRRFFLNETCGSLGILKEKDGALRVGALKISTSLALLFNLNMGILSFILGTLTLGGTKVNFFPKSNRSFLEDLFVFISQAYVSLYI
jgi:hypothetical protein